MKSTLTVRIPPKMRRDLARVLKENRISVSDLLRDSLARYMAMQRFRALRKIAVKKASKAGFYTDEDIFRVVS